MVSKRHAKPNNHLADGYDPEKPSSHIRYLDANNLYGRVLPTGAFRWKDECEQLTKTIADHPADDAEGFILEVDLEYPEDLHNAHNAYPLAPERIVGQSIITTSSALGWRRQSWRSWSRTSITRTAMCFTIGICRYTCLCACVGLRPIVPSGSIKALG